MANGDLAAAAGMDTVPGTDDIRMSYDEINKTRDYIADRTSAVTPITKGGTGANTAAQARTNLGVPPIVHTHTISQLFTDGGDPYGPALQAVLDTMNGNIAAKVTKWEQWDAPFICPDARYRGITSNYASIYADQNGVFGIPSSSRNKKKNLTAWTPEDCARFLELVQAYWGRYRGEFDDVPLRPFFILEEFDEAGFGAFVIRDDEGKGVGLHYELTTVALHAVARHHEARLSTLEADVAELKAAVAALTAEKES